MSGTIPTHIENDSELPHIAVNGKDVVSLEEVDLSADTLLLDCEDTLNRERSESDESHDVNESSPFTFEEHKPQKNDNGLKIIIIMSLVFAVSVTTALIVNIYIGPHQVATHGAVSCGVEQCSQVGVEILKKGGHAVDGAVATMLCMGLIGAESSGIGGGGFMLIRDGDSVDALDFRETAPGDSTQDMYSNNNTAADIGGLAVAVPGELKGMQMAWKKYGRLRWSELFHPTIQLAKEGFKVTGHTVDSLKSETAKFSYSKKLRDLYMPGGVPVKEGDTLKRLDYAEVLDTIAKEGIDAFYNGSLTNDIVATVKNAGGILTKKDLYDYKAIWKTPLQTMYHDYKIYQVPEPAGGAILISIMNIMEGYNLTKSLHNDPLTYHRLIEAFKFAYAQKTRLGDPKYVPDVNNLTNIIISKENALKIRNKINDDKTFDPDHYDPHFPSQSHGTATVTVQDSEGNMVAVTTTVNTRFGSAVMTNSSILLNNEMSDFSWPTQHPQQIFPVSESNYIQPGKRPQSATVPTIVLNSRSPCDRRITLGGNGGTTITTGIAQILLDLLSYGNSTKDSIIKPRVHHELIPNKLLVEAKLSKTIVDELKTKGHNISIQEPVGNELMAIMMTNDKISAYADDRKKGSGAVIF